MLSGKRAFRGDSMAETMSAILREDPPDLSVTNKTVSPALERVVHHCLEKNPDERFHSARDLAFAIESLSGTATSSGQTMTAMTSLSSRSRVNKKLPWIVAALFALALIAALPFVFLYFRRATEGVRAVRLTIPAPEKGVIPGLSVSPDGGRVVYGAPNPEGKLVLWMRPLDALNAQPLPGADRPFFNTFWSPAGRFVSFVSDGDNKLKMIDVTGGPPQTLAAAPNWRGRDVEPRRRNRLRAFRRGAALPRIGGGRGGDARVGARLVARRDFSPLPVLSARGSSLPLPRPLRADGEQCHLCRLARLEGDEAPLERRFEHGLLAARLPALRARRDSAGARFRR